MWRPRLWGGATPTYGTSATVTDITTLRHHDRDMRHHDRDTDIATHHGHRRDDAATCDNNDLDHSC